MEIRNDKIFLNQTITIIFEDYTHYSEFCKYTKKYIDILGYISLYEILKFCEIHLESKITYRYGYTEEMINISLNNARLHKFKRKYKTDGTWPISVTLPYPVEIKNIIKEEI